MEDTTHLGDHLDPSLSHDEQGAEHYLDATGIEHVIDPTNGTDHWVADDGYEHYLDPSGIEHVLPGDGTDHWYDQSGLEHYVDSDGNEHFLDAAGVEHVVDTTGVEYVVDDTGLHAVGDDGSGVLHYDPAQGTENIVGHVEDLDHWHVQADPASCAVVSQQFIIEAMTGEHVSEEELLDEAKEHGWWMPGGGTSPDDVGKILELHGIGVDREHGATFDDLVQQLEDGHRVIVAVDADEIWAPGQSAEDDTTGDVTDSGVGIPGQDANHALEVVGVDTSDPDHPMVILNDSSEPGGQGHMVPLEEFESAWADSDHYMVATTGDAPDHGFDLHHYALGAAAIGGLGVAAAGGLGKLPSLTPAKA